MSEYMGKIDDKYKPYLESAITLGGFKTVKNYLDNHLLSIAQNKLNEEIQGKTDDEKIVVVEQ